MLIDGGIVAGDMLMECQLIDARDAKLQARQVLSVT